jgi:BlaI family transcriptional regulator, penicillinase repressor
MPKQGSIVTDAELSVLDFLWTHGPSPVREISHGVYAENTPAFHATVNSLLEQLETKGYVDRDRSRFAHVFKARVDRATLVGMQLQQLADSHFGGGLAPMLLTLIDNIRLKPKDRNAIRRIVESIE